MKHVSGDINEDKDTSRDSLHDGEMVDQFLLEDAVEKKSVLTK
jgi:hypothetical protein